MTAGGGGPVGSGPAGAAGCAKGAAGASTTLATPDSKGTARSVKAASTTKTKRKESFRSLLPTDQPLQGGHGSGWGGGDSDVYEHHCNIAAAGAVDREL